MGITNSRLDVDNTNNHAKNDAAINSHANNEIANNEHAQNDNANKDHGHNDTANNAQSVGNEIQNMEGNSANESRSVIKLASHLAIDIPVDDNANANARSVSKSVGRLFGRSVGRSPEEQDMDKNFNLWKEEKDKNQNKGIQSYYASQFVDATELPTQPNAKVIKIMCVGDPGVGKTCFVLQWAEGAFNTIYMPTVGMDYKDRKMLVRGKDFVVEIWDTAGSERLDSFTKEYYRVHEQNMEGILLMYDVTNSDSFKNLERWITKVKAALLEQTKNPAPMILIGNKSDLESSRVVKKSKAVAFSKEKGMNYFESSGKFCYQIDEPVLDLCTQALARRKELDALRKNLKNESKKGVSTDKERSLVHSITADSRGRSTKFPSWRPSIHSFARGRGHTLTDTKSRGRFASQGRPKKRRCVIL